jgi:hypothetical protein
MYEVGYEKNEVTAATMQFTATMQLTATSVDCTSALGLAIFWNSAAPEVPCAIWNMEHVIYIKKLS